jgi:hypothetical protein
MLKSFGSFEMAEKAKIQTMLWTQDRTTQWKQVYLNCVFIRGQKISQSLWWLDGLLDD